MIYLEITAIAANGSALDAPYDHEPPLIPSGKRLVALLGTNGSQRAIDVTSARDYRLVYLVSRGGSLNPVRLYLIDERDTEGCSVPENDDTRH
jgi:hypothetical protein